VFLIVIALFVNIGANPSIDFDTVAVSQTKKKIVTLSNAGDLPLKIYNIQLKPDSSNFSVDSNSGFTLSPDEKKSIAIYFKADKEGQYSAELIIKSNDVESSNTNLNVEGETFLKTSLRGISKNDKPNKFKLNQNYPNPFNSTTTLKIQIPRREKVSLTVYNILGQKIKTLIKNKFMEPGYFKFKWHGKDATGASVSSGIYFIRMQAQDFSQIIRMTYTK